MVILWIGAIGWWWSAQTNASAQDDRSLVSTVEGMALAGQHWPFVTYLFSAEGKLIPWSNPRFVLDPWYLLLTDPFGEKLLELADHQRVDFNQIKVRWRRDFELIHHEYASGKVSSDQAVQDATKIRRRELESLEKILLPFQKDAIIELYGRNLIVREGFIQTMVSGPGFRLLELGPREIQAIMKLREELIREVEQKAARIRDDAVEKFLASLDEADREQVLNKWKSVLVEPPPQTELLRYWLALDPESVDSQSRELEQPEWETMFLGASEMPRFDVMLDGSFRPVARKSKRMVAVDSWRFAAQFLSVISTQEELSLTSAERNQRWCCFRGPRGG